jgi:hypothetical protein
MKSFADKIMLVIILLLWCVGPVWGGAPYKIYTIIRQGDQDIVCDSYIVQKGDHVWELLRRKGTIAEKDFPQFVSILKRLNPNIKDVDKIYPRQQILIPLKQTEARERQPDKRPRYITIPIIPDILYVTYEVRPGDCLAKIITTQLGLKWDELSQDYVQTLKRLNPAVDNLDLIYPGQPIRIPEVPSKVASGTSATPEAVREDLFWKRSVLSATETLPYSKTRIPWWEQAVSKTMAGFGGKLLASGQCYFPGKDQENLSLDLATFPVIEMEDGRHLILKSQKGLPESLERAIRSFWEPLIVIGIDPGEPQAAALDKVFRAISGGKVQKILDLPELDDGIRVTLRGDWILSQDDNGGIAPSYYCVTLIENPQEHTSAPVVEYLAKENIRVIDILAEGESGNKMQSSRENAPEECSMLTIDTSNQEAFVSGFVTAMGYSYEPRVPLTFEYAGLQVETTTNMIHSESAMDVVVDFGTFYGDAESAIEAGGLKVVSISPEDEALAIVRNVLAAIGIPFAEDPVFFSANRNIFKAISLTIPGVVSSGPDQGRTFLTPVRLHPRLCDFLMEREIKVVKIKSR